MPRLPDVDRRMAIGALAGAALLPAACAAPAGRNRRAMKRPLLIAHRGASGERPEHTLAAYALAIEQGADFIEPDLVLTRDGVLVARHENEISETTDVAAHARFADRRTSRMIDGQRFTGWFTEDFTLEELKTLRARERLPQLRPANTAFDGQFAVPTFDEVLALARAAEARTGRTIGVYPETKHPSYFDAIGLSHDTPLLAALERHGYRGRDDALFIQSFEVGNLQRLRGQTALRLIQLMDADGAPADRPGISYAALAADLPAVARHADGIGPAKAMVIPRTLIGTLGKPTDLVRNAHDAGLAVHPWTFRRENYFLPTDHKRGIDPRGTGDLAGEIAAFLATGIDGLFSDNVAEARAVIDRMAAGSPA